MNSIINTKKYGSEYWEIIEAQTKGKRPTMEDHCNVLYPFNSPQSLLVSVFDGHAGNLCSNFLSQHLPTEIQKHTIVGKMSVPTSKMLKKDFMNVDKAWLEGVKEKEVEDGSTALCLVLYGPDLMVANCGDSRALLYQAGEAMVLTRDHVPEDREEKQRILKLGGTVIGGRLQGKLGVSRAFGNMEFKESNLLISEPEIKEVNVRINAEFLLLGCDGLFEQFSNEEIVDFIKSRMEKNTLPLEQIVQELVEEALDRGTDDNISVIVVKFTKAYQKYLKKQKKNEAKSQKISAAKGLSPHKYVVEAGSYSDGSVKTKKEKHKSDNTKHVSASSCPSDPSSFYPIIIDRKLEKKINKSLKSLSPIKTSKDSYRNDIPEEKGPKSHVWGLKSSLLGRTLNKSG